MFISRSLQIVFVHYPSLIFPCNGQPNQVMSSTFRADALLFFFYRSTTKPELFVRLSSVLDGLYPISFSEFGNPSGLYICTHTFPPYDNNFVPTFQNRLLCMYYYFWLDKSICKSGILLRPCDSQYKNDYKYCH